MSTWIVSPSPSNICSNVIFLIWLNLITIFKILTFTSSPRNFSSFHSTLFFPSFLPCVSLPSSTLPSSHQLTLSLPLSLFFLVYDTTCPLLTCTQSICTVHCLLSDFLWKNMNSTRAAIFDCFAYQVVRTVPNICQVFNKYFSIYRN